MFNNMELGRFISNILLCFLLFGVLGCNQNNPSKRQYWSRYTEWHINVKEDYQFDELDLKNDSSSKIGIFRIVKEIEKHINFDSTDKNVENDTVIIEHRKQKYNKKIYDYFSIDIKYPSDITEIKVGLNNAKFIYLKKQLVGFEVGDPKMLFVLDSIKNENSVLNYCDTKIKLITDYVSYSINDERIVPIPDEEIERHIELRKEKLKEENNKYFQYKRLPLMDSRDTIPNKNCYLTIDSNIVTIYDSGKMLERHKLIRDDKYSFPSFYFKDKPDDILQYLDKDKIVIKRDNFDGLQEFFTKIP